MPRMLHIRPAEGRVVREPTWPHPFIPCEGCVVAEHPYWWRKLVRGDVVLVEDTDVRAETEAPKPVEE